MRKDERTPYEKLHDAYVERFEDRHRESVEREFHQLMKQMEDEAWTDAYAAAAEIAGETFRRRMERMQIILNPALTKLEKRQRLAGIEGSYTMPHDPDEDDLETRVRRIETELWRSDDDD